ncbi:MAG TPA: AbrB/MazE/SpoVT family DNA-binding domain-containing protein [Methylocella sp.]|nr:AbrB/MazE/SpoVT family DNA-binding domain-containing protein [Methylocella sp.]
MTGTFNNFGRFACGYAIMPLMKTDVTKIGDSLAVTVPDELAGKLGIKPGDTVFLTETKDGLQLTTQAPSEYEEQLASGRAFVERHKKAFQLLANR